METFGMRSKSSASMLMSEDMGSEPEHALLRHEDEAAMGESCTEFCCDVLSGDGARAGERALNGVGFGGEPGLVTMGVEGKFNE